MKRSSRVVLMSVPLLVGMAIGVLWSEVSPTGAEAARPKGRKAGTVAETAGTVAETAKPEHVQRFGSVIGVKPEKLDEYVKLHAATWPEVLDTIKKCNIRNYSIYLGTLDDGNLYLFSYFEYVGTDMQADMKKMAADPNTQRWWKLTDPCQIPQKQRKPGEQWMSMKEVFHTD
jgi:L-rhamnose mutarotase